MPRRLPILDDEASAQLARLHRAIDVMAAPIVAMHEGRLQCKRGCSACCIDGITVFALEAAQIASQHAALLEAEQPHPEGACAFLDGEGACRIYEHRPYVCRTQGLPLRWLEERDGEVVELRDTCELNFVDPDPTPLSVLSAEHCFTLGPVEQRLREQAERANASERVPLRSLWKRS
jgi:hypothetical protein